MQSLIISALLVASAQAFLFGNLGLPGLNGLFGGNQCDPCAAAAAARSAPYYPPPPPPPQPQYVAPAYPAPRPTYVQPQPTYVQQPQVQTYQAPEPVATGYVQPPPPPPPAPAAYASVPNEVATVAVENVASSGYKN